MNQQRLNDALDFIEANPERWDQRFWHCGSKHCLAGWGQLLSGMEEDVNTVWGDARVYFGLTGEEASYLFCSERTLEEMRAVAACGEVPA